jgi:hypothetical protein
VNVKLLGNPDLQDIGRRLVGRCSAEGREMARAVPHDAGAGKAGGEPYPTTLGRPGPEPVGLTGLGEPRHRCQLLAMNAMTMPIWSVTASSMS